MQSEESKQRILNALERYEARKPRRTVLEGNGQGTGLSADGRRAIMDKSVKSENPHFFIIHALRLDQKRRNYKWTS
jgi:hypothetical protein